MRNLKRANIRNLFRAAIFLLLAIIMVSPVILGTNCKRTTLISITITAEFAGGSIPIGEALQLAATALYSDDSSVDVTNRATWMTSDATVATVEAGLVTGLGEGTASISTTFKGVSDSVMIEVTKPTLAWATGSEGVLLRWFVTDCPTCRRSETYNVYRDGTLLAEVRRLTDEAGVTSILGQGYRGWIKEYFDTGFGIKIASVSDLHEALDDHPVVENWLANNNYALALVRGLAYLDGGVSLGETHTYRVVAGFPDGLDREIGVVEIEHLGLTPLSPPSGLVAVSVIDTALQGDPDWAKAQKNRKADSKVFLRWDVPTNNGNSSLPWVVGYDIYRATDEIGPYKRINDEPVLAMPAYLPQHTEGSEYDLHGFYFADNDPDLLCCNTYYYRVAPRDLLGHPREWLDRTQQAQFSEHVAAQPPDTIPPQSPQNLEATPDHITGEITLRWEAASVEDGATRYLIYRSTTPQAGWPGLPELDCSTNACWQEVAAIDVGTCSTTTCALEDETGVYRECNCCTWVDRAGEYEKRYWYVVRTEDTPCPCQSGNMNAPCQPANMSAPSQAVSAILHDRVPPGKPQIDEEISQQGTELVKICASDDAERLLAYVSLSDGPEMFVKEFKLDDGSRCLTFNPNKYYSPPLPVNSKWRFCAVDKNGNRGNLSDATTIVLGPDSAATPAAPVIVDITTQEIGTGAWAARLSWEAADAPGLTGFRIYRDINGTRELVVNETKLGPEARSFDDVTVNPGIVYSYTVAAYRAVSSLYGVEAEVPSQPRLYKLVPPLECCTRPLTAITWNSQYCYHIVGTGTQLKWTIPDKTENVRCVVFRSLQENGSYVQLTPPFQGNDYLDNDAEHNHYWYVVLQLHWKTSEVVGRTLPWSPGTVRSTSAVSPTETYGSTEGSTLTASDMQTYAAEQIEMTLMPVADTWIYSEDPSRNYGSESYMRVGYQPLPGIGHDARKYSLVRFDLSKIPPVSLINKAKFYVYLEETGGAQSVEIGLLRVTSSWAEQKVTWDNQRPSMDGVYAASDVGTTRQYYTWDVTSLVQEWVNSTYPNCGLALWSGGTTYDRVFHTREGAKAPRLEINYTPLPKVLDFGDGFVVNVTNYNTGSTLDSLSGKGTINLGGGDLPTFTSPVSFSSVKAEPGGKVLDGKATLDSPVEVDYPYGFHYTVIGLTISKGARGTDGLGEIDLTIPTGIVAHRNGLPEVPFKLDGARIKSNLTFQKSLDVTALPQQKCSVPAPSLYFEMNPLPLRIIPTAAVLVTHNALSFASSCTQYEERYTGSRPNVPDADANDGYLRAVYQSNGSVSIGWDGLYGIFGSNEKISYATSFPYGFQIHAGSVGDLKIEKSQIAGGIIRDCQVSLTYYQTAGNLTTPTGLFVGDSELLEIGVGGSLYGLVKTALPLEWAKSQLCTKPGFSIDETWYEVYIPPIETNMMPWQDAQADYIKNSHIQPGLNRVTTRRESVDFEWRCCDSEPPITFPEGVQADVYVRRGGVSGLLSANISMGSSVDAEIHDYKTQITGYRLSFCDNYIFHSDVSGDLYLPYPSDVTIPLIEMKLDPDSGCVEGGTVREDADPLVLTYWQVRLHPDAVEFRNGDPNDTHYLWILGTVDIPHLSSSVSEEMTAIPLETCLKPDGTFCGFNPGYNEANYRLSGFSFLLRSISLNNWNRGHPSSPGWNHDANLEDPPSGCPDKHGFITLHGKLIVPYFGELVEEDGGELSIYLLPWDDATTPQVESKYIGFSDRPRAKRYWTGATDISWDFELVYAQHHTKDQGIFAGLSHSQNLIVLNLAVSTVIEPRDDDSEISYIFLGMTSGASAVKALHDTTEKSTDYVEEKLGVQGDFAKWSELVGDYAGGYADITKALNKKVEEWEKKCEHEKLRNIVQGFQDLDLFRTADAKTLGKLHEWQVKLEDVRGQVGFEPVYDGNQIVDYELAALEVETWFEVPRPALVKAKRIKFEITRDGDYILSGKKIKSSIFKKNLSVDFIVAISVENGDTKAIEGGLTLHKLNFDAVKFKNVGAVFGVGEDILYIGALADVEFKLGEVEVPDYWLECESAPTESQGSSWGPSLRLGGAVLFGKIDPSSQVLKNMGFQDLLDNLDEVDNLDEAGADGSMSGGYVRVYGDFPLYKSGCVFELYAGAEVAGWYFVKKDGLTDYYGGKIRGYVYGKALCVISARGDLTLLLAHPGNPSGQGSFKFSGEFWVAGGIGWCEPEKWNSWEKRWWGDSWCWTCGAMISLDYNDTKADGWSWNYDADFE